MKSALTPGLVLLSLLAFAAPSLFPQAERDEFLRPKIEISRYGIEATLTPDTHEIEAAVTLTFRSLEQTDHVVFDINENLWVRKILNAEGIEQEFEQGSLGPGILSVIFAGPLEPLKDETIRIEYWGGFDRDRFSRMYSRDDTTAYIGNDDTYLMYGAEWVPISSFLADRATVSMEVTVPLGMTVIGPGTLESVVTKGINETFRWVSRDSILPVSLVAGRYFRKEIGNDDFTLECFVKSGDLEPVMDLAQSISNVLSYYTHSYGPSAAGTHYRLVEVDDRLKQQHGMLGTIFITKRELEQPSSSALAIARRIAYQWWRETIGVKSTSDLWLEDGMAYYSAAEYEGKANGKDAFKDAIDALAILALKFENIASVRDGFELGYRTDRYESVVAGKGAWILHMLRGLMGDSKFEDLIRRYIDNCRGGKGSTGAFQKIAEDLYGQSLSWYFAEWVDTTGIPSLESNYVVYKTLDGFRVIGAVEQDRDLFRMPLEVAVLGADEESYEKIELSGRSTPFDISAFSKPKGIVLDPRNKILQNTTDLQTSVQLALGNDRKEQGDFIGAIRAYQEALKLSPQKSIAHYSAAEVYFEQFNYEAAADSFRSALNGDLDPKWIEVWCYIYLGKIYDITGQRQRAMAEYTKAVNTKDDTRGAQAEAKKWLQAPFTRRPTVLGE